MSEIRGFDGKEYNFVRDRFFFTRSVDGDFSLNITVLPHRNGNEYFEI